MPRTYRKLNFGLVVWLFLASASSAIAETPKEQLQATMDRIIKVLQTIRNPQDIDKNRSALHRILLTRFDFAAMAQQSLANRWGDLQGRKEEFIAAFTDFVENGYMSTLGSYRGEKIVYDRDRVDGETAEVNTRVVGGEGEPIRIDYKLHPPVNSGWSTMRSSTTSVSLAIIALNLQGFFARFRWRS